jgi:hypothetical protein
MPPKKTLNKLRAGADTLSDQQRCIVSVLRFSAVGDKKAQALPTKPLGQAIKDALASAMVPPRAAGGDSDITMSQEARLMLEAKRAADQQRLKESIEAKKAADRERIQNALEESKATRAGLQQTQNDAKKRALAHRIGDITKRLEQIRDVMRSALMWGDKHWAAALAKEAAQLAKDLAAAIRNSGTMHMPQGDYNFPTPNFAGGDGEGQTEGVDGVESVENIDVQAPEPDTEAGSTEEAEARAAAAEAEKEAAEAGKLEDVEGENDQDDQDDLVANFPDGKKPGGADAKSVKDRLDAIRNKVLDKTKEPSWADGLKKAVEEVKSLIKEIMSMAKQIVRQKSNPLGVKEDPKKALKYQEDVEKVDKEIAETFKQIDAMVAQATEAEAAEMAIAAAAESLEMPADVPVEV